MLLLEASVGYLDNERSFGNRLKEYFHEKVKSIEFTRNQENAVQWAKNNEVDIFLSDLKMEGKDGISILEEIRLHNKQITLFLVSGHVINPDVKKRLREIEAYPIRKQEGMDNLFEIVHNEYSEWIRIGAPEYAIQKEQEKDASLRSYLKSSDYLSLFWILIISIFATVKLSQLDYSSNPVLWLVFGVISISGIAILLYEVIIGLKLEKRENETI